MAAAVAEGGAREKDAPLPARGEAPDAPTEVSAKGSGNLPESELLLSHSTQEAIANQLAACYLSVMAFLSAVRSPAVLRSVRAAAKPMLIAAACQYAALMALLLPIKIILRLAALLSGSSSLTFSSHKAVASSLAIYPFITILLTKYVYKSKLADCFFASLREVDPRQAEELSSTKVAHARGLKDKVLGTVTDDADDPMRMMLLMLVASTLRSWRWVQMGPLGYVVVPLAEFLSIRYLIGRPFVAAALSAVAIFIPPARPLMMDIAETWASSRALGQSSMRHFLSRAIPKGRHAAFIRTFESTIITYFALPTLAMRLPVGTLRPFLGPLLVFPAAAIAAYCVHDITTRSGSNQVVKKLAGSTD